MRSPSLRVAACALAIASACPASALADAFVPDDPPSRAAACVTAAGDVVVTARADRRARWIVEVSEAGGAPRTVTRGHALVTCPRVAVAPDGTAVVDMLTQALVRRPGGGFGAPVAVGAGVRVADVAAAPGGWVAVAGVRTSTSGGTEVVATIFRPDGSSSSAVLDRAPGGSAHVSLLAPRIGIDGHGTATVAWTYGEPDSGRYELRTSTSSGEASWAAARTFGEGAGAVPTPAGALLDVAVAPAGHTLLAWADGRGMHASVDGGAAQRLSFARSAGSPTASIADDGTAFVAYAARRARIVVNDRLPSGTWSPPRLLARPGEGSIDSPNEVDPQEIEVAGVVAADGRAVVAWSVVAVAGRRIVAVSGRAGAWSRITPVSLITRDAVSSSLSLDAAGDPRLAWLETLTGEPERNRLRASRLVAGPVDRTAPAVTTRLPSRPRLALRVPVTCSEACDARVRLTGLRYRAEIAAVARRLRPAVRSVVRVRPPGYYVREMRARPHLRRVRIEVLVTDRAGNVTRKWRIVRFRIG